jgi:hypothetical protein
MFDIKIKLYNCDLISIFSELRINLNNVIKKKLKNHSSRLYFLFSSLQPIL